MAVEHCFEVVPPLVALYPLDQPLNAIDGRHECASCFLLTVRAALPDFARRPDSPKIGDPLETPQSYSASLDRCPRIGPGIDGPPLPLNQTVVNLVAIGRRLRAASVRSYQFRFSRRAGDPMQMDFHRFTKDGIRLFQPSHMAFRKCRFTDTLCRCADKRRRQW